MQSEKIILISPTHEQSVYAFHVERSLSSGFIHYLKQRGIVLWREPEMQPLKPGEDEEPVIQLEFESDRSTDELEGLAKDYLRGQPHSERGE